MPKNQFLLIKQKSIRTLGKDEYNHINFECIQKLIYLRIFLQLQAQYSPKLQSTAKFVIISQKYSTSSTSRIHSRLRILGSGDRDGGESISIRKINLIQTAILQQSLIPEISLPSLNHTVTLCITTMHPYVLLYLSINHICDDDDDIHAAYASEMRKCGIRNPSGCG